MKKFILVLTSVLLIVISTFSSVTVASAKENDDVITLRISNCEEYIDEGSWDEEEDVIDLDSGDIFSDRSMVEEFEDWYYKTYGKKVKVEYSTYGTNEDLYNQITLGDRFDLVCPSDYMCMKMIG
ncbi:MAG: spermidine/putrescine ABC transporter substrate-binding protein, partial [Ruminococcus sp.]